MSKASSSLLHIIRTMTGVYRQDSRSDDELLRRYAETRDEKAFTTLVVRHGPMVWGVCKGILGNTQDAEDASQVVLLALANEAGKIRIKTVAGWLHQVARRTALDARKAAGARKRLQKRLKTMAGPEAAAEESPGEVYELLHDELANLPEPFRVTLVLHYLEGKSAAETAKILGVVESAVWKRLARGRSLLQMRLSQRGIAIGATALAAMLGETASQAGIPPSLVHKTVQAVAAFRDGELTGDVAELARGVLKRASASTPWWTKGWLIALVCASAMGAGAGVMAWRAGFFGVEAESQVGSRR